MAFEPERPEESLAEFAELNNMLTNLQRDLAKKNGELDRSRRFLESILDTTPSLIYIYDLESESCTYVNEGVERLLGFTSEQATEAIATLNQASLDEHGLPESVAWHEKVAALSDGDVLESESRVKNASGDWRWLIWRDKVLNRRPDGTPRQVLRVANDVTKRVQAEDALRDTMKNLERSNTDLEQFAYVASHDLREPLRMVSSYLELIKKRYEGQLDSDADEFIEYAVDGAVRMQRLVEKLLEFSRAGAGNELTPVESRAALDRALVNLGASIRETDARIIVGDLPTVMADEDQLIRVFQNLIGNAIKYRRPQIAPQIEVSATRIEEQWRFSCADNGVGIDPDSQERVFDLFQRAGAHAEQPGTGIGLAVCRRIIERLGGSVWVEVSSDSGTTFCFTLPAA